MRFSASFAPSRTLRSMLKIIFGQGAVKGSGCASFAHHAATAATALIDGGPTQIARHA